MTDSIKDKIRKGELPRSGYELTKDDVGTFIDEEFGVVTDKQVGQRVHVMIEGGIYLSVEIGNEEEGIPHIRECRGDSN